MTPPDTDTCRNPGLPAAILYAEFLRHQQLLREIEAAYALPAAKEPETARP
jgi:hypothetical protein